MITESGIFNSHSRLLVSKLWLPIEVRLVFQVNINLVNLLSLNAYHLIVDTHSGIISSQLKLFSLNELFQISHVKVSGKTKVQVKLFLKKA